MYELVNTSLPNGLIAGSHGFATVAMTKGLPDAMRSRLEGLCTYIHRSSAHDATYFTENPVNWFHVALPQGVHAIGRIAPCDFDYTGRTNRIANIRTFGPNETVDVGGAEMLSHDLEWFCQGWSGEPRYLKENKLLVAKLKMLEPVSCRVAENWERIFGSDGTILAKRVARQLENNITIGRGTIWFRASAKWDASGNSLLGLFRDLINLLPPTIRRDVAFSTYSDSLPNGLICHLRGICDVDKCKAFSISSATSAWVDCDNAKVVHEELLPVEDAKSDKSSAVAPDKVTSRSELKPQSLAKARRKREASALMMPKKDRIFGIGLFVAAAIFAVVGFAIWGVLLVCQNNEQMHATGADLALVEQRLKNEQKAREEEAKREAEEKKLTEERQKKVDEERRKAEVEAEKQRKEKEDADRRAAGEAERRRKEKEEAERIAAEEAELAVKQIEDRKTAFLHAQKYLSGMPQKPKTGSVVSTNAVEYTVYYYVRGTLTNTVAKFVARLEPRDKRKVSDWKIIVSDGNGIKKLDDNKDMKSSPVVIWLKDGTCWFANRVMDEGVAWFADNSVEIVDLQNACFGPDENVYKAWVHGGKPVKYMVIISLADSKLVAKVIEDKILTRAKAKEYASEARKANFDKQIKGLKAKNKDLQNQKEEADNKVEEKNNLNKEIEKIKDEIKTLKEEIDRINGANDRNSHDAKEEKESLKGQKKRKEDELTQLKSKLRNVKDATSERNKLVEDIAENEKKIKKLKEEQDKGLDESLFKQAKFVVRLATDKDFEEAAKEDGKKKDGQK